MLEIQKAGEEEIKYNNPRNEMDNGEINDLKENLLNDNLFHDNENLQLPELKFSWWWLLFGIPFVIDLCLYIRQEIQYIYIYNEHTQNLKTQCLTYQKEISQLQRKIIGDSSMDINSEDIKLSGYEKNKYIKDLTEKDNQINELEFQLRYITRLNNYENYEANKKILHACLPVTTLRKKIYKRKE